MPVSVGPITVLGVAGTVQTGKSELGPVFEECGWEYHDLNDPQCDLRAKGTERYELFNSLFPGCLREDGAKLGPFYDLVTPEFYHARIREDLHLLVPIVRELCAKAGTRKIALSWEYLPLIAEKIPLDHTLLFTSKKDVWMDRLRKRLTSRGVTGKVTDDRIFHAIQLLDVWPETISWQVEEHMAGKFTEIDASPEDWGAEQVKAWFQKNGIP